MTRLDLHAISSALFLPLLLWTGSVVALSLLGYPGIVYMTPAAWLLALPVGLRVWRESESAAGNMLREAALSGAVLGLWQTLLAAAAVAALPYLPGKMHVDPPSPFYIITFGGLVSVLATAVLAAGIAWVARRR